MKITASFVIELLDKKAVFEVRDNVVKENGNRKM